MANHRMTIALAEDGANIFSTESTRSGAGIAKFDQVVPANTVDHMVSIAAPLSELVSLLIAARPATGNTPDTVDAKIRTNAPNGGIPDSDGSLPGSAGEEGEGNEFEFVSTGFITWQSDTGQPCPLDEDVTAIYLSTGEFPVRLTFIALLASGVDE